MVWVLSPENGGTHATFIDPPHIGCNAYHKKCLWKLDQVHNGGGGHIQIASKHGGFLEFKSSYGWSEIPKNQARSYNPLPLMC